MGIIHRNQYHSGPVDYYTQTVDMSAGTSLPNLGASTGIQTTVAKPSLGGSWDLDPMLRQNQLTTPNSKFTTFGGVKGFQTKGASKYKTFEEMMKVHKIQDRSWGSPYKKFMGRTLERP